MKIYDISVRLAPTLVTWPGEKGLTRSVLKTLENSGVELSRLDIGSHTGTHLDAPRHFVEGAGGIDAVDLARCVGPARVLDATAFERDMTVENLLPFQLQPGERVLFKTTNSLRRLLADPAFHEDYIALTPEAAEYLVRSGVLFVGVDYLSCERKGAPGHPVHTALLRAGIPILEGAQLARVPAGQYMLCALPLFIPDGDASPARAILASDL